MPTSAKPRKKYRPKVARVLPINIRFSAIHERTLQLIPHEELEKVRHGTSDESSMHTIVARLNLGYVLAGEYFEQGQQRDVMEKALVAAKAMRERFYRTSKVGSTGDEFFAIGDGLNLTDEMQTRCSRRELDRAMRFVYAWAGTE